MSPKIDPPLGTKSTSMTLGQTDRPHNGPDTTPSDPDQDNGSIKQKEEEEETDRPRTGPD